MTDLFQELNPEQITAVRHSEGPALVVAGPGSGKTRVLTHHAAYLIKENLVQPAGIFLCTFTNKAANEMKERIRKIFSGETPLSWTGTFHSLCSRLLRIYGPNFGISKNFVIYDQSDAKTLIRNIIKEKNLPITRVSPAAIQTVISSAKNELIDEKEYARYAVSFLQENVAKVYPVYQKLLRESNAFDFDDLILESVRLLKKEPRLLEIIHNQFKHILIDEYQDTNKTQYALAKLLAAKNRNLYAVGDASQAIYSFRGADFRNILSFERDFPDAKIYRLSQNYRSTRVVIESAKAIIKNNTTHISLDLWTENEEGGKIRVFEASDEVDEANYIVCTIRDHLKEHPSNGYRDFAVFYRTNAQSRVIEEIFLKESVPYLLVGGVEFYERKEIKDVLSLLRLFVNPNDVVSRERLEKLGKKRTVSYLTYLSLLKGREGMVGRKKPIDVLDTVLQETDYLILLKDGTEEGEQRVENVRELRSVATSFGSLIEFLENVSLIQRELTPSGKLKKRNQEKDAVHLMTLHAAKGLEFTNVFLTGLEEGLLPHARSLAHPHDLEEERRLCYVGITRARKNLHLTYSRERLFFGSRSSGVVSRFLGEIPESLLAFEQSFF